jgi:uncharacterized protein
MPEKLQLNKPWLVAVWPGMGHVAISAGYYLISKLDMDAVAEFSPRELFDIEHVDVKKGIIKSGRLPRSRFFTWRDPKGERDLVVFIGEAQPPIGRWAFCKRLIEFARELGVEKVFTFAAMATPMRPEHDSRVFAAAIDKETLDEFKRLELNTLEDGQISGLNGVLLGVAASADLNGGCLLGEMPHVFSQFPFPQASLAVLSAFRRMTGIEIDLSELAQQAEALGHKLEEILTQVEHSIEEQQQAAAEGEDGEDEESFGPPAEEPRVSEEAELKIDDLFAQARKNRSKAYELKRELDRLEVFDLYEDRFLDLFKKAG